MVVHPAVARGTRAVLGGVGLEDAQAFYLGDIWGRARDDTKRQMDMVGSASSIGGITQQA